MKNRYILQLVCYSPKIYAGLDKFFVLLTKKLRTKGITPVYIYSETMDAVPQIQVDIEAAGGIVELMPSDGKWAIIKSIRGFYKKYHPELVDVHFVPFVKAYAALLSRLYGMKHITHIHSLIANVTPHEYVKQKGIIKRILLGVNYAFLNTCGKVICVSRAIERQFNEWAYGDKKNIETLYLGTDLTPSKLTKQQARKKLGLSQDDILFVNISAKEELKSIDRIIESLDHGKFVHIGGLRNDNEVNKRYENQLISLVKNLKKEQQVIWLGKRNDIKDILPAFDVYVHPSSSEGLPVSLMEAASAGLPLIGTDVGGIPELIKHEKNGLLLKYGDWQTLHDDMELLWENFDLRKQYGDKARKIVSCEFDMDKQTDKLIAEYGLC